MKTIPSAIFLLGFVIGHPSSFLSRCSSFLYLFIYFYLGLFVLIFYFFGFCSSLVLAQFLLDFLIPLGTMEVSISFVSKAKTVLNSAAAKAEKVITEIKADLKRDFGWFVNWWSKFLPFSLFPSWFHVWFLWRVWWRLLQDRDQSFGSTAARGSPLL